MGSPGLLTPLLLTALFMTLAGTAHAANFAVTSKNRLFCCTNPLIFLGGQPGHALKTGPMGSMIGSGYQPWVGPHPVTQGTGPAPSIMIGKSEVVDFYSMFTWMHVPSSDPPPPFKYIKGTASFANGSGTLKKGGGYGSFSFCPKAKGPGVGACTDPGDATPASFNGRIYVRAGPNQFGGTLQILAGAGGIGGTRLNFWRWLGPYNMYPARIQYAKLVSSPVGAMTPGKVAAVDDLVTRTVTHTAGSMLVTLKIDTDAVASVNGAGPFTTGTVYVGVTANGTPMTRQVTIYGYDARTAMGAGKIQLVSGLLLNTHQNFKNGSFGWGWTINLPEPRRGLGLAAGALALLLLSCSRRRRL